MEYVKGQLKHQQKFSERQTKKNSPLRDLQQKSWISGADTQEIFEQNLEWHTGRYGFSAKGTHVKHV